MGGLLKGCGEIVSNWSNDFIIYIFLFKVKILCGPSPVTRLIEHLGLRR